MPNLSQLKRERMLAFLQKIKDEHLDDDDMLIALGEIESELTSKKYGLVWEQHEEAVDVMMRNHIPVFTEVPEREITAAPGQGYNFILEGDNLHSLRPVSYTHLVKRIRIHDLRHSHISLLIDMGFSAVAIADRVGHESIEITYRYAHLFPSKQKEMASKLNDMNKGE